MRYATLSTAQLLLMTALMSLLTALVVAINTLYLDLRLLPEVHVDATGVCVKVVNYENGHAFNCQDLDVLLRRYRIVTPQ